MIFGSFLDVINSTEILVKINFTEISVISTEINNLDSGNTWTLRDFICCSAVLLCVPQICLVDCNVVVRNAVY